MWINPRQASTTGVSSPTGDRRRVGLLATALALSWASMVVHNMWELPLTLLDVENMGPLAVDIALLVACWRLWRSRGLWTVVLAWGLLNMVIGGIVTVLPLPVLPFVPEQTLDHYAVHAIYAIGQLPLVLVAGTVLRQLRQQQRITVEGGHDVRADG